MPYSHFNQLGKINELIILTNPRRILDIGMGFGTYGFLSRLYLDIADGRENYKRWLRVIDGIEVFKDYLTPVHNFIYNRIFIGNASRIVPALKSKYDLILLIDVIEHFPKKEGKKLLQDCLKKSKNVILATPKNIGFQADAFGNKFETHKYQWKKQDFTPFPNKFFLGHPDAFIVFIGEDAKKIQKKWLKRYWGFVLRSICPQLYDLLWKIRGRIKI